MQVPACQELPPVLKASLTCSVRLSVAPSTCQAEGQSNTKVVWIGMRVAERLATWCSGNLLTQYRLHSPAFTLGRIGTECESL